MRSTQEFIHWLEMGGGARRVRLAAAIAATIALSFLIAWKQFHGPATEDTLVQADLARQLAAGQGFTTHVNYPQTDAVLVQRGIKFDAAQPYPELYHAPLYPLIAAAVLRLTPGAWRTAWFTAPTDVGDGFGGDYFLLGLNLAFFWITAWLTYLLGRRLFDVRVGWVAALAVLVSLPFWQQTLALNGTPLLMALAVLAFLVWHRADAELESAAVSQASRGAVGRWWGLLGLVCGLLFLTEYTAGALVVVVLAYALLRSPSRRWLAVGAVAIGFLLVSGPWVVRNLRLTGNPVALAAQNVALKAGDPTAEPAAVRATLSAERPAIQLRKLGNKTLTALQTDVRDRVWSGGAMWLGAFFVVGWLYTFRSARTNRLRWAAAVALGVLALAQAALNSGESERLAVIWLAPLMIVFGVGFFFVLLGSHAVLGAWPRAVATALLVLQGLPLLHEALAPPPAIRFQYPPYFPALLHGLRTELRIRGAAERFGIMADVPAGVAWYADTRCWAQPPHLRDFYAITLEQPIGELLLTPRTLDRPFFSELNAHPVAPGALSSIPNRFGEWGEVYAGLVTGTMPREFPLTQSHKVAENLAVLLNPALPPPRSR